MLEMVLDSLVNQIYKNLEIIIVDDGSTDNTAGIMKKYPQMIYLTRENAGAAAARNTGLEKATGEIIHFIDSDVICPPDLIEIHVKYHNQRDNYIVQSQLVRIVDLKDAYKEPFSMMHYSRSYFDGASVSVRKKYIDRIGGFDSKVLRHGWDDLEFGARLLKIGLKPKRLVEEGYVWHYEGDYKEENIRKFFKKRYKEGQLGVLFYRQNPTFAIKMMVMAWKPFFWLGKLMFKEEKILVPEFFDKIATMIREKKVPQAIARVRFNGYCFYLKGVEDKIKEDGYLLRKN
jgi:glycosyltransferase involved in cell wall biosynthesis